jgi:hypothetical protein
MKLNDSLRSLPNQRKNPSSVLTFRFFPIQSSRLQWASIWYTSVRRGGREKLDRDKRDKAALK